MTGATITVSVDDSGVRHALAALAEHLENMQPAFEAIGQYLVTETDLAFREERDPWGGAWPELSATTLARRRGGSAQILSDTRRLANSIHFDARPDQATVGTDVIYAATHQFGRADNRFFNTPTGRPAPIPARPFLPISPEGEAALTADMIEDLTEIVNAHLRRALQ